MAAILEALAPVLALIFRELVDLLMEKANEPDTAVHADRDRTRADRLRERVREAKDRADPTG